LNPKFLGIDIGGTKSHALVADATGIAVSFASGGTGSWEHIGWDGYRHVLSTLIQEALDEANIGTDQIAAAGFGIAGFDWPCQKAAHLEIIQSIGINCPIDLVNDAELAIYAGSPQGWGIAIVAGTGCNCRGWNKDRSRTGRMVGGALWSWEFGGGIQMVARAMRSIVFEWTKRGEKSSLTEAFIQIKQAKNLDDLIEGLYVGRYQFKNDDVLLVFNLANEGNPDAQEAITWLGQELGDQVRGVIHQLSFEDMEFDVVMGGSLFYGSPLLEETLQKHIFPFAPGANLIQLTAPPVVGGVLLSMDLLNLDYHPIRQKLIQSTKQFINS
jgi:N-acetylglucosamine kinase-like BadF-type ATPase